MCAMGLWRVTNAKVGPARQSGGWFAEPGRKCTAIFSPPEKGDQHPITRGSRDFRQQTLHACMMHNTGRRWNFFDSARTEK